MLNALKKRNGQNTAEYAIVVAVVVAAVLAMQTYIKRSLAGGIKYVVDRSVKQGAGATTQFEPDYQESEHTTTVSAYKDTEQTEAGDKITRTFGVGAGKVTSRTGSQTLRAAPVN